MITVNLKEGILQLSKKRLGVFVQKSTFPDIHQNDEVVEINNYDLIYLMRLHSNVNYQCSV